MKMSNEHYPYLCGGILLNLLIESKKTSITSKENLNGKKFSITDPTMLKGLLKLVTGEDLVEQGGTFKKETSLYKNCKSNGKSVIPFSDYSTIDIFKNRVKYDCWQLMDDCIYFVDTYLSEKKLEWLTKALFEIIINDPFISENTIFKVTKTKKVNKRDLKDVSNVDIEIFLISVLMHIIYEKQDNTLGRETLNKYFTQNGSHTKWELAHNIGKTIEKKLEIKRFKKENIENKNTIIIENKLSSSQPVNIIKENYPPKININLTESPVNYKDTSFNYFYKKYFYNLIVGGIEKATYKDETKTYGYFVMKKDRILNLWCDDLVKPLSRLSSEERDILVSFPTIFAIDQGPNGHKNGDLAYYGFIRKITVLGDSVKIFFEIISSFSQKELYKNSFAFGIEDFELYNTHWSVKEVHLEVELNRSNIEFF